MLERIVLVALLAGATSQAAVAQSDCDQALSEAESSYRSGNFEKVEPLVSQCLRGRASRQDRAQAFVLMAKVKLVEDDVAGARAMIEQALRADPDLRPERQDPTSYVRLIEELRVQTPILQVASVSKTRESLREAPATVVVVSSEEIAQRGYLDLEQVFHDLPGFDISRTNGIVYSGLFQRGFRSEETSRTLVLVDGVEENDLWTRVAWLSRQYPLSVIDRIEVIYGPASTMYGPNAFAGVINIITKDPEAYLVDAAPDGAERAGPIRRFGGLVQVAAGPDATELYEATAAGRSANGDVSWSITGRRFRSDEQDLSGFDEWDYDPADFERFAYADILRLTDPARVAEFLGILPSTGGDCTGAPDCPYDAHDGIVELTEAGRQLAIALDQGLYLQSLNGRPVGFSDQTDDWLISAKLEFADIVLGFQTWRREEGSAPWFTDTFAVGSENGQAWIPEQTALYLKYTRALGLKMSLNLFSRYKLHELDGESRQYFPISYRGGTLGLDALLFGQPAYWVPNYFSLSNTQLRNELNLVYEHSARFNLVTGIEVRSSSVQGDLVISNQPNPSETGRPASDIPGGNQFSSRDVGVYAQASFKPRDDLKFVVGGRLDDNEVRETLGYGTVFNPRLAVIYMPKRLVFKAIYSEAFQDPTNQQKFSQIAGQSLANPDLEPETVRSLELSASCKLFDALDVEVAAYENRYQDTVQLVLVPPTFAGQSQGIGELKIRGVQLAAKWQGERFSLSGNYNYTDPVNTNPTSFDGSPRVDPVTGEPIDEVRVGDIAEHRLNLVGNARLRDRLNLNLRLNYVGSRETGFYTTVLANPRSEIDSYFVGHLDLAYEDLLPGLDLELIVANLFDTEYEHPGPRAADGSTFTSRSPQPGRGVSVRLSYRM